MVANGAMAREHDVIGEDDAIAHTAIVAHMGIGEKSTLVAHGRLEPASGGTGIHGDAFTDQTIGADGQRRHLAAKLQILRRVSDGGEGIELGAGTDAGSPGHDDMADEFAAFAQNHIRSDMTEGADADAFADRGSILDNGTRMDFSHVAHSVTSMAPISASATRVSPTRASPRNHHMVRR